MVSYDISFFKNVIIDSDDTTNKLDSFNLSKLSSKIGDFNYDIYRYNKSKLTEDNIQQLGLMRSLIIHNNKIVSFSPPKSISSSKFIDSNKFNDIIIEEFIDGTMINLFHVPGLNDLNLAIGK